MHPAGVRTPSVFAPSGRCAWQGATLRPSVGAATCPHNLLPDSAKNHPSRRSRKYLARQDAATPFRFRLTIRPTRCPTAFVSPTPFPLPNFFHFPHGGEFSSLTLRCVLRPAFKVKSRTTPPTITPDNVETTTIRCAASRGQEPRQPLSELRYRTRIP